MKVKDIWVKFWEDRFDNANDRFWRLASEELEVLKSEPLDKKRAKRLHKKQLINLKIEKISLFMAYGREGES